MFWSLDNILGFFCVGRWKVENIKMNLNVFNKQLLSFDKDDPCNIRVRVALWNQHRKMSNALTYRTCGRDRQYGDRVCSFAPTADYRSEVSTPCETGEKNLAGARGQEVNIWVKLLAVQVHCSESTQQWWTNETLSIKQQLLFIATQCCRLNCRNAHSCTKVDAPFYESVQRKCTHRCTKVRELFEVAVELSRKWQPVHYRGVCTSLVHYHSTTAVVTVHRSARHALTMLQYHLHALCELSSLCMHILEIIIVGALSQ